MHCSRNFRLTIEFNFFQIKCVCVLLYSVLLKCLFYYYTGYFTSDNEPDGIENATHNTFLKK
jgi:hypothetical protein